MALGDDDEAKNIHLHKINRKFKRKKKQNHAQIIQSTSPEISLISFPSGLDEMLPRMFIKLMKR